MSQDTSIEWTESTWNPVTGCTKVSEGCRNCYAERMALRLKAMGQTNYKNGFDVTLHEKMVDLPLKWKNPQTIFVNSMSDLFHELIPIEFIKRVFYTMEKAYWHHFQVLTKRSKRLAEISTMLRIPQNVWIGVSVENQETTHRINDLLSCPHQNLFLSLEPLLGPLRGLCLKNINWVIVGGESGPRARPMNESWVIDILRVCQESNTPFFFKQWGGTRKKKTGRVLLGRTWDQKPSVFDVSLKTPVGVS